MNLDLKQIIYIILISYSLKISNCLDLESTSNVFDYCCMKESNNSNYNLKIPDTTLLFNFRNPIPNPNELFGSSFCLSKDRLTFSRFLPKNLENSNFKIQNPNIYIYPTIEKIIEDPHINFIATTLSNIPENKQHYILCREDYLIVSDEYQFLNIYVRVEFPEWILLESIPGNYNRNSFDFSFQYEELYIISKNESQTPRTSIQTISVGSILNKNINFMYNILNDLDSEIILIRQQLNYLFLLDKTFENLYIYKSIENNNNIRSWIKIQVIDLNEMQLNKIYNDNEYQREILKVFSIQYTNMKRTVVFFSIIRKTTNIFQNLYKESLENSESILIFNNLVDENHFSLIQSLDTPTGSQMFGYEIKIKNYFIDEFDNGMRLVVSDPMIRTSVSAIGIVYIYEWNYTNEFFVYCCKFQDFTNSFKSYFGFDIELTNRYLYVSIPYFNENKNNSLIVYDLNRNKCKGCDSRINSNLEIDICGKCGGDNSTCIGCDGIPSSGIYVDMCDICGGQNNTCVIILETGVLRTDLKTSMILNLKKLSKDNYLINISGLQCELFINLWMVVQIPSKDYLSIINGDFNIHFEEQISEFTCLNLKSMDFKTINQFDKDFKYLNITIRLDIISEFCINSPSRFQFYMSKNNKIIFKKIELEFVLNFFGCFGCDNKKYSSGLKSIKFDICNQCGGDGSSCLDCSGVPFGNKIIDFCEKCTAPKDSNQSCIYLKEIKQDSFICKCKKEQLDLKLNEYFILGPEFNKRILNWKLINKPKYGTIKLDSNNGDFKYQPFIFYDSLEIIQIYVYDIYIGQDKGVFFEFNIYIKFCEIIGCDNIKGSGNFFDKCGVCGGNNSCYDCLGNKNGNAILDICGVCNGNNTTCDINSIRFKKDKNLYIYDIIGFDNFNNIALSTTELIIYILIISLIVIIAIFIVALFIGITRFFLK